MHIKTLLEISYGFKCNDLFLVRAVSGKHHAYVCVLLIFSDDRSVALLQEFVELQNRYAILQQNISLAGLTKDTLGKVKRLKDAAAKLAGDTEDTTRRIIDKVCTIMQQHGWT